MNELNTRFFEYFDIEPSGHVRSPLRICPLGAHVDHQGGLVTGIAVDQYVDFIYNSDPSGLIRVQSLDFPDEEYFMVDEVPPMLPGFWGNYIRGSILSLNRNYKLKNGLYGVIRGKLPMGGLSSSAAVTTAYLMALMDVNGIEFTQEDLIQYSHWVEREFIGLKNGILDQAANVLSRSGYLMFMDCAKSDWRLIPKSVKMPDFDVVIINSGFNKALIGTDYNNRVDECKIAASILQEISNGSVASYKDIILRNIGVEDWNRFGAQLPGRFYRRAKHFFTENERVRKGLSAWENGNLNEFGRLMTESGESSVHDYECGSPELITIFDVLKTCPGVYGTRFSGAGYRGCCIGFADPSARKEISERIAAVYPVKHPQYADKYHIHFCRATDGSDYVKGVNHKPRIPSSSVRSV